MKFVLPAVLLLFSLAFFTAWLSDRGRSFLVHCGTCFLLIGLAMLVQLGNFPADDQLNTVLSAALYVGGTLVGGYGILQRSGLRLTSAFYILSFFLIVGGVWYFCYVESNLLSRVYVLNLGMATLILSFAWQARRLFKGALVDKLLLVMLVLVALQLVPRTLLTARSLLGVVDGDNFAATVFWQWTVFSTAVAAVLTGFALLAAAGYDRIGELSAERDSDPLTGLLNRRGLEKRYSALSQGKKGAPGWVAVCDIDYFKALNDAYGHAAGDAVLKEFAGILRKLIGERPLIARTGGEEFVICLDGMHADNVLQLMEGVRQNIERHRFQRLSKETSVTCSIGCVRLREHGDFWQTVDKADKILYAAKKDGRNRIYVEGLVPGGAE
ncbi:MULTISPECIES: GGDEF domain-containing protein [unclassified Ochrobactrum]|uniref:GGDEF domain-containing protein n=1 Tax=unclassified Ochrobactrum TaxID=239106 RepID=UPI000DEF0BC9|nr:MULTISPECIES: GGDEF domain-containing protein [unclassified Ochrobactrum]MBQ0709179.1 GGDEF domain-containing protein [Ochrobactrum sp. AP1BH01-1]